MNRQSQRRGPPPKRLDMDRAARLRASGMRLRDVADAMGVCETLIRERLRAAGVNTHVWHRRRRKPRTRVDAQAKLAARIAAGLARIVGGRP